MAGSDLRDDPRRSEANDRVVPILQDDGLLRSNAKPCQDLERRLASAERSCFSAGIGHRLDDAMTRRISAAIDDPRAQLRRGRLGSPDEAARRTSSLKGWVVMIKEELLARYEAVGEESDFP
jgi:hypothetical protein